MRYILLLTALIYLNGCATTDPIKPPEDNKRKVVIDERLLVECKTFTKLKDNPQPSDVLEQHGADVLVLKECADSKKNLIEVVRKAFE